MTQPQNNAPSPDDLLFGSGAKSYSFKTIGETLEGILVGKDAQHKTDFVTKEKKYYSDGNAIYQLVLTLKTELRNPEIEDDDGTRRVFCSPQLKTEVARAISAAGGKALTLGAKFRITFVREVPAQGNPKKEYSVTVTMPADLAVQQSAPVVTQTPVFTPGGGNGNPTSTAPGVSGLTPELIALMAQLEAAKAAAGQ